MKFSYLLLFNLLVTHLFSQEVISFKSSNPFGFKDVITNLENLEPQEVNAVLRLPKGKGPFPLIIGGRTINMLSVARHTERFCEVVGFPVPGLGA